MTWLSKVAVDAGRLLSLLELVSSSTLLSKSEEKCPSYWPLSMMIIILLVSLEVSTTLAFDLCPSHPCQSLICRFLLKKYVGWFLLLTSIILSGGRVLKTKKFFFLMVNPIIFPFCFNIICSR